MRIDLFEFVESVFRGFVYFIYNAIETLWDVTRSPRRGPVRRHRAHQRASQRQIGGLTFLFLLILLLFGMASLMSMALDGAEERALNDEFKEVLSLQSGALWSALIATVLIDATLRVLLRLRLPERPGKRVILVSVVEYSLTWPVIVAFFLPLVLLAQMEQLDSFILMAMLTPAFWVVALVACGPAASFLYFCARRPGSPKRGKGLRRFLQRALVQVGVFLLLFVSVILGFIGPEALIDDAEPVEAPVEGRPRLEVTYLRCAPEGSGLRVIAALHNPQADAMVVDVDRDLKLMLDNHADATGATPLPLVAEGGPDVLPVLLAPGATRLETMTVANAVTPISGDTFQCSLTGDAPQWAIEWSSWVPVEAPPKGSEEPNSAD